MIIKVEKWIIHDKKNKAYDIVSYRIIDIKYCCEKIKTFPMLDLYYKYCEDCEDMELLSGEDNSVLGMMLQEEYSWYDDEDTYIDQRYHLITHCPRCGEKIEINIVREVDKTEEYNEL
jgi:hypothetical protein